MGRKAVGDTFSVPDDEGAALIAQGVVEEVVEPAPDEGPTPETKPPKSRKA
jgi:hypothetical protein